MCMGFCKIRPVFLCDQAFGNCPFPVDKMPKDVLQTFESWPFSLSFSSRPPRSFQEKWKQSCLLLQYVGGIRIFLCVFCTSLPFVSSLYSPTLNGIDVNPRNTSPFSGGLMDSGFSSVVVGVWVSSQPAKLLSSLRITANTWGHPCAWFCLLCTSVSPIPVAITVRNVKEICL